MELGKFLSTEFLSFISVFVVASVAFFTGKLTSTEWSALATGLVVTLGTLRRIKEGQQIKASNGNIESTSPPPPNPNP